MQYKGKSIVDVPSAGTKYVPIIVHTASEQKDMAITDINVITGSLYTQIGDGIYPWKEAGGSAITSYLSFIEENNSPFTLRTNNASHNWDGILYYSTDTENWIEWDGTEISSSNDGKLYVRGKGNTTTTGNGASYWGFSSGKRIQCLGNIENLLDYEMVEQGNHPIMADHCYSCMFQNCTSLTKAPELPATTLTDYCYQNMFENCKSLTQAPELPATTLANNCYGSMFQNCTSLTQAPELPATTLADSCYYYMFRSCTSLIKAPELPATILANNCYYRMFSGCTSLIGQIHCASSTAENSYRLTDEDISGSSATIVFDL